MLVSSASMRSVRTFLSVTTNWKLLPVPTRMALSLPERSVDLPLESLASFSARLRSARRSESDVLFERLALETVTVRVASLSIAIAHRASSVGASVILSMLRTPSTPPSACVYINSRKPSSFWLASFAAVLIWSVRDFAALTLNWMRSALSSFASMVLTVRVFFSPEFAAIALSISFTRSAMDLLSSVAVLLMVRLRETPSSRTKVIVAFDVSFPSQTLGVRSPSSAFL